MIDGNQLREEFGRYLAEHKATRWGMDAALMHVCKIAYDAGKAEAGRVEPECMRLPAAAPAPAEVPMPQGYVERPSDYTGGIWIESQMRTYGDAREAAGYAHAIEVVKRLRDSHQTATGECQSDCDFVTAWDSAIDALRGEVKP